MKTPDPDRKQDQIKSRSVSAKSCTSCDFYDKSADKNPPFDFTFSYIETSIVKTMSYIDSGYRRTSTGGISLSASGWSERVCVCVCGGGATEPTKSPFPFRGLYATLYLNHISFTQLQHSAFESTYAGSSNPSLSLRFDIFTPFGSLLQNDAILFSLLSPTFLPSESFGRNSSPLRHRHVPLMIKRWFRTQLLESEIHSFMSILSVWRSGWLGI